MRQKTTCMGKQFLQHRLHIRQAWRSRECLGVFAVGRGDRMTALLLLAFAAAPPPALFAGRVLDAWRDDLNSPDALVLEEACLVLSDIGPLAAPARGGLRQLLNHPGRLVRLRAALALWRVDRDPTACLPVIGDGLRGGDL